jgi:thiamine biosynthesis lipoprotein
LPLYILSFTACERIEPYRYKEALGTLCFITLYDQGRDSVYNDIFARIAEIENLMSVNIPDSDISRINKNAGIEPVRVHEDTFKVIERAVYFSMLSDGAFDSSVGPLVKLWNIGGLHFQIPSQEEIDKILPLVNWRNIVLDAQTNSVFLLQHGMALDLGSIAKGYAADEALKIIKRAGIERSLIDLGGNIIVHGEKKDKSPWKVGIQHPYKEHGTVLGFLQTMDKTVVTSGVYQRYSKKDGIRYHHIFSPSQGYPAQTGLLSVTLIMDISRSNASMDADALSTAIFVLGYEKGFSLLKYFPGTEAIFVFEDNRVIITSGLNFTLTDDTFSLSSRFIQN